MPDLAIGGYPSNLFARSVTILSGASTSEIVATQGMALVGIIFPSGWTAADVAFKSCITGNVADLIQVYSNGGSPEATKAAASRHVAFPTADAIFVPYIQLFSVSTADDTTPVTQGADRSIILLFRNFLS